jgi:hypothetical protein
MTHEELKTLDDITKDLRNVAKALDHLGLHRLALNIYNEREALEEIFALGVLAKAKAKEKETTP